MFFFIQDEKCNRFKREHGIFRVSAQVRNCTVSSVDTKSPLESISRTRRANSALADIAQPSYLVCGLRHARLESYHAAARRSVSFIMLADVSMTPKVLPESLPWYR
jgi:hypothetical protein